MHAITTGDCAECGKTAWLFMVTDTRTKEHYGFCQVCIDEEFERCDEWQRARDLKTNDEDHQGR